VFPPDHDWKPQLGPMSIEEEVDVLAEYLRTQSESDYLLMKGADIQINRDPITWDMTWDDINKCEAPRGGPGSSPTSWCYRGEDVSVCLIEPDRKPHSYLCCQGSSQPRADADGRYVVTGCRLLGPLLTQCVLAGVQTSTATRALTWRRCTTTRTSP
jgi:hypothetical protein